MTKTTVSPVVLAVFAAGALILAFLAGRYTSPGQYEIVSVGENRGYLVNKVTGETWVLYADKMRRVRDDRSRE